MDREVERLLRGLTVSDDAQDPPGRDGDPQLSALLQFLQLHVEIVGHDDIILDVGSGKGILAHQMLKVWPDEELRPWYYAADQDAGLERLALPPAIHNRSVKLPLPQLATLPNDPIAAKVKIVVVRNVFHHLHIADTASMLLLLRAFTDRGATVYIQDMGTLAALERYNTGWPGYVLRDALKNFGFALPGAVDLKGRSGTPWYALTVKQEPGAHLPNRAEARAIVVEARREQLRRAIEEKRSLGEGDESAATYLAFNEQIAVLNLQLYEFETGDGATAPTATLAGLPLRPLAPATEYAEEIRTRPSAESGLKAILSSKSLIDLPALVDTATTRLWFAGYSQRLLFAPGAIRDALKHAVRRGVNVRILIVDPSSDAARARGGSEAYSAPDELVGDIVETIDGFKTFSWELEEAGEGAVGDAELELRLCDTIISSSFFLVDATCICSLYSFNLRGGSAPAFVLRGRAGMYNDYFSLLVREFQTSWLKSNPPAP